MLEIRKRGGGMFSWWGVCDQVPILWPHLPEYWLFYHWGRRGRSGLLCMCVAIFMLLEESVDSTCFIFDTKLTNIADVWLSFCKHPMIVLSLFTFDSLSLSLSLLAGPTVTSSLLMWIIVLLMVTVQSLGTSEAAPRSAFRRQVQRTARVLWPLATAPRHLPYHWDSTTQRKQLSFMSRS